MSERGSGRTTRQLAALPDGGVYLVHTQPMVDYCKRLLIHLGRKHDSLTFVTPPNVDRAARGKRIEAWDVDHAFFDLTNRGFIAYDVLEMASGRGPLDTR